MAFCKRCNCVYHGASWLGEYCSQRCAYDDNRDGWKDCAPLYDPNDPTGSGVIAANRNEVEAMLAAGAIDPRLPKIIMLRKRDIQFNAFTDHQSFSALIYLPSKTVCLCLHPKVFI